MAFKSFYHGTTETQWDSLDEARLKIKQVYDDADDSGKADLESKFNERIQPHWPVSAETQLEVLTIVNELLREATASGI